MSKEKNPQGGFVRSTLPWIAGAAALVVFLFTLNHWVNLRSLPVTAKVAGWELSLPGQWPLFYTITYPFRFFPAGIEPLALNAFTALCGALTIVLLARSVALLPHDRTHEQRQRERSEFSLLSIGLAWVPVALAAGVCAFQLTFWEHATAVTGEILDLLFFAYVIRCLLEYRVSQNEGWLSKMAVAYGLAVTNNWAMIGFFPGFLAAVIWIKGLRFFDPSFLVRMVVLGLGGLLLYLLLPAVWVMKGEGDYSFWDVLRANLANQKLYLADTPQLRNRVLLLGLTSVLPVVLMGVRWPSSFGDTSVAGASLTNFAFRVIHLFFLAAGLLVAFDPKYSPRALGLGLSFLTFYYLGALAIGYYSGYALLVFTDPPRKSWRRDNPLGKLLNPVVRAAVLAAAVAVPAGLLYKNYALVRAGNGDLLKEFTAQTIESLPNQRAYLLSEDPFQLALLQASLKAAGKGGDYVLANARLLEAPNYHEQMRKEYGERWPLVMPVEEMGERLPQVEVQRFVYGLAASNTVYYLHSSFGYFFEGIYAVPQGQVFSLHTFKPEQILPPALGAEALKSNRDFWARPAGYLKTIESLRAHDVLDAQYVAQYYSRALNRWGVELQRAGELAEAGPQFAQALALNTNNVPARLNLELNEAAQAGKAADLPRIQKFEEKLGTYRTWDAMLSDNGPFEHPEFCRMLGETFLMQNQFRQAALQFSRVAHFQPANLEARAGLARALIYGNWIEEGLASIAKIEADFPDLSAASRIELASLKSAGHFGRNDLPKAEQVLKAAVAAHPEQSGAAESLFQLYKAAGQYTNALAVIDSQLQKTPTNIVVLLQKAELQINREEFKEAHRTLDGITAVAPKNIPALLFQSFAYLQEKNFDPGLAAVQTILQQAPDNVQALLYRGIIHMEQKQFDRARESFDAVLKRDPANLAALRNRAVLNLRAQRWSEAKDDYLELRKKMPTSHAVMYGLAEVAYTGQNREEAARYYEAYLKYVPNDSSAELAEEKKRVEERLAELKRGQ